MHGLLCVCTYDSESTRSKCRNALIAKVTWILNLIEREGLVCGRKTVKVKTFYIGKLYIRERKNQDFTLKDYETWSVAGIQKQWREHRCEEYGMIMIAAIGQESIPEGVQDVTKEQYTLALEIHHFKLFRMEPTTPLY